MKLALGIIIGIAAVILLGVVSCVAVVGGISSTIDDTTPTTSGEHESTPEEEAEITFTAADAGTVTDYVGDVHTVVEIAIQNDSDTETVTVNEFDFSAELADGSVRDLSGYEVDLENPLDAVDVGPGQSVTGQLSVSGDVDVAKVQWENNVLSHEKETTEVQ